MFFDEDYEKREQQRKIQLKKQWERTEKERVEGNNKILSIPEYLSKEEKESYVQIVDTLKESIKYKLSAIDVELVWQ